MGVLNKKNMSQMTQTTHSPLEKNEKKHNRVEKAMNYQEAWEFLDQLQFFKIKLGLDSMNQFLERLGNPHRELNCIHIGGANGKGSVGATLCSLSSLATPCIAS